LVEELEQGYDANDLIRNRKVNDADSVDDAGDETKTMGNLSVRSKNMTPMTGVMGCKDNESMKSIGADTNDHLTM
jgi:hypothetical protein